MIVTRPTRIRFKRFLCVNIQQVKQRVMTGQEPFPRYRSTRREGIRYPRRLSSGGVSNVTLSRIPRNVEANRHYDLIKQRDVFSNHQTVTSFLQKKFVTKKSEEI